MHQGVALVVTLALAVGCGRIGPGTGRLDPHRGSYVPRVEPPAPTYPQRSCAESIQARADGVVADPDGMRFLTHHASCAQQCSAGGGAAVCVEAALLAHGYAPPGGIQELVSWCNSGDPQACAWVESHQDVIAVDNQRLAAIAAQQEYDRKLDDAIARERAKIVEIEANDPIAKVAAEVTSAEEGKGYRLAEDRTATFGSTGEMSFQVETVSFNRFDMSLITSDLTPITAEIRLYAGGVLGGTLAFSKVEFGDVDVMIMSEGTSDRAFDSMTVSIKAVGGHRGDVRMLRFEARR
jgi:hypothetical protein